ncbi:prostaglandin F synthase 1-like isoform X3 [Pseudophryne corroboree]|uniref:prostaglandin F synthase 1-like isoform X3 n=1 Tax=Pseudophryne corroboree TaxID=495146 RepID=UPI00308155F2
MAAGSHCSLLMNDGKRIPVVGFGTYAPEYIPVSQSERATEVAIEVGFRHIDGAHVYGNEKEVGRAIQKKIADGTVKREDLFYTGKLWSTFHQPELVEPNVRQSLEALQLEYMDLFLIHWPFSCKAGGDFIPMDGNGKVLLDTSMDLCAVWEAMEKCKDAGLVKSIGVSNFNRRQLEKILNKPGLKYKPVCNQVECHPYLNQSRLLGYCKSKDILLSGYSVLGSHRHKDWVDQSLPLLLEDATLAEIGKKYNKSPAHVAIRYQIQRGVVAITKSYTPERIRENFKRISPRGISHTRRMSVAKRESAGAQLTKDSCLLLNDGNRMPVIGLGTFTPCNPPDEVPGQTSPAASGNKTSYTMDQLWCTFFRPHLVRPAIEKSLQSLQMDYVDLCIIHHPTSLKPGEDICPASEDWTAHFDNADLRQTWEALEQCKDAGLVKSIGVSNFNRKGLELILNKPGLKYKPVCNQIECHPYLNENELLDFCKSEEIALVCYGVMGTPAVAEWTDKNPSLLTDPVLLSIGEKYKKSPGQVAIRYTIQRGCAAIVKSFTPGRILQNIQVFDFNLSPEEMKAIDNLNRNLRYYKYTMWDGHPQLQYHTMS